MFDIPGCSLYNKSETRAFPIGGERPFVLSETIGTETV